MLGDALVGGANAYSIVAETNHKLEWWAVILAGVIIVQSMRMLNSEKLSKLSLPLQRSAALLLQFAMLFSIMLILIQFESSWLPYIESGIEWIEGLL